MTDIYAVAGKPVLHSRSPQMHNAAFAELGMDARYLRLAAESAAEALRIAREAGMKGINVTSPFKEDMAWLMDESDRVTKRTGAVNTVVLKRGKAVGHNTDAYGVAKALEGNGVRIKGSRAVVLGAGGGAKAALAALTEKGAHVTVTNRSVEKAAAMAGAFGAEHCALERGGLTRALRGCSAVVGCASTAEQLIPRDLLEPDMSVLEANYSVETALARDAKRAGCRVIDGREWLVYQGAKAFELFTARDAPLAAMHRAAYARAQVYHGNIALIGFMGTGKDSVAHKISGKTGMVLRNVDDEIERSTGVPVAGIFEGRGEEEFRRLESTEMTRLKGVKNHVVACGGGAVLRKENRDVLAANAMVVWLWAKPSTIAARLKDDDSRPLLKAEAGKESRIKELLAGRMGFYANASDLMVGTEGKKPEWIAERIIYENKARSG